MNKKMKSTIATLAFLSISTISAKAASIEHTVISGDSLWKLSQIYKVSIESIKSLNHLSSNTIYIGQKLYIPDGTISQPSTTSQTATQYKVVAGDSLWNISKKYNTTVSLIKILNNLKLDTIYIGQILKIPVPETPAPEVQNSVTQITHIEYTDYTVQKGDNFWSIAQKFKIPYLEVIKANNLTESSILQIGQVLKIPVHIVPVKPTPAPQYGELLDWWTEAQYVFYTGATGKVTDFYTQKSFYIKRTTGANHGDCETLTAEDTRIMKEIFENTWSWSSRPVIIEVEGRRLAASLSGMPHAGLDAYPALSQIDNRTGNYGTGPNYDYIKNNNMDGHFDVHFLNSTRHSDGLVDSKHQENVRIAAGK